MATFTLTVDGAPPLLHALHVDIGHRYVIGRASDADFPLPDGDRRISRYHAAVEGGLGGMRLKDLGSNNGTFVNGTQVDAAVLKPGDRVRVGTTVLVVGRMDPAAPKLFGLVRLRAEALTCPTELDMAEIACARCGATWPAVNRAPSECVACQPRRPLGPNDPRSIGELDLLGVIGTGPASVVYEARDRQTEMRTAFKRLLSFRGDGPRRRAWFEEIRASAALLGHGRLVATDTPVWDAASDELGVSMEWLRAGDCRKLAGPRSAIAPMLRLGADLFDALAYVHAMGLVHGGVKPENLLLTRAMSDDWRGQLADFGVHDARGKTAFTAPERLGSRRIPTPADDIYSAAATVSYLLTGAAPPADRPAPGARAISLSERRRDIPAEVAELLDSAVEADPAARCTAHAGEIAIRLRRSAQGLEEVG